MHAVLTRRIIRRNPFQSERVPWIARVFRYPFDRWASLGQQALLGAPNFLTFVLFQKLSPFRHQGIFQYAVGGQTKRIRFNALNTQFQALYRKSFARGYEPSTTALLDLICPTDGVFYDIGSNWGWFSLVIASKPGFRGEIHAFEPFPSSYADLRSVVEQAGLTERVHCHNVALSARSGTAVMRLPDHFQSGLAVMEEERSVGGPAASMVTLDSLKLPPPAVIKIDVEGAEIKILQGGARLLAGHQPMLVFENTRSYEQPFRTLEPLKYLRNAGYRFFHVGWVKQADGLPYVTGNDGDPDPQDAEWLAIRAFSLEERFLLHDGMNIFACHVDKLGALEALFQPRSFDSFSSSTDS